MTTAKKKIFGQPHLKKLSSETENLNYFCDMIEEIAGIHLKPVKHDLVRTRLRSRIEAHGFQDLIEYSQYLKTLSPKDSEWESFTNLLTTNKTDFFRESKHFDFLIEEILPAWLKTNQKVFKVWSAASSTGEEAYTLAMILRAHLPEDRDFKILATDIDTDILKTAKNSVYPISKKVEIPPAYYQRFIDVGKNEVRGWFRIKPELKERVIFKQHNLIEKTSPGEDVFDLVLCRNVLIYFGEKNIDFVQKKLFSTTKNGGYLFIGHSESFQGLQHPWKIVSPSVFQKVT